MLPARRLLVARAVALLTLLGRAGVVGATPPTVGIDLTALDEADFQRLDALALEKRLVLRLVQEGFAVVALAARPQTVVRLQPARDSVVLTVEADGASPRERRVPVDGESLAELHLEIVHKVAELVRAAEVAHAPAGPAPPAAAVEIVAPRTGGWGLAVAGGADAVVRTGGVDALPRLDLAIGRAPWAAHLEAGFAPSSGTGIDVGEWELLAGGGWRLAVGPRLTLELGGRLGVLVHTYELSDPSAKDRSGQRVDLLATLPVSATYWIASALGIELRLAAGASSEARQHVVGARTLWERGAFQLEGGLALVWRVRAGM